MNTLRSSRFGLTHASWAAFFLILLLVIIQNFLVLDSGLVALLIFAPQHGFAMLPLVLGLVALGKRRTKVFWLNGVSLLVWAHWLLGWNVPLSRLSMPPSDGTSLRIMSYNVQRGERGFQPLLQIIKGHAPDILCIQESQDPPPSQFQFPAKAFKNHFHDWETAQGGDVMTLSRFPLVSRRTYPLQGTRRILETIWLTPRGKVRVLNVHIAKSKAEKQLQGHNWRHFASQLIANSRVAAQTRLEQLPNLDAAIAKEKNLPLIMAGDFNSPPRGPFYRAITTQMKNSWAQGGWGNPKTFPARWPLMGIDYIFLRDARATRVWTPHARASDHLPMVADVILNFR